VQRVVILGRGGSGESVLANDLGRATRLPVIELDDEFWNDQLEPMPMDSWTRRETALAEQPCWIMDGDLGPYDDLEPRLAVQTRW
jgi:adenylate kinase family enzyme